jgi:hypothetical protein
MENYNSAAKAKAVEFLMDSEASLVFGRMDYALKNGVHVQRREEQETWYRFIAKHFESLLAYYQQFFGVQLRNGGESLNTYYYLDFWPEKRGHIPAENRHFLPNEFVIVGFMIYKIIYIDQYIELDSLATLKRMIRLDYEDLKPGLYHTLAKAKNLNTTEIDDDKLNEIVDKAMKEFAKIGWVALDGDYFDVLPSFQRLNTIYQDYINGLDQWLKQENQ